MAEEGGLPTWGSANVNTAIVVSLGAGLATGIGGAVAFVPQIFASVKQGVILSVALAISAGVMLYVSFIEIFVKAQAEIEKSLGPSGAAATTTACFFAGMLFCVVLELLVHKCMGHGRAAPPSGAATSGTDGGSPGEVSVELGNVTAGAQDAKALTDGYAAVATSEVEQKAQLKKMGALTAVAIALHNFPEGLATFMATVDDPSMGVALGERAIRRNSVRNIRRNFSSSPPPRLRHRDRDPQHPGGRVRRDAHLLLDGLQVEGVPVVALLRDYRADRRHHRLRGASERVHRARLRHRVRDGRRHDGVHRAARAAADRPPLHARPARLRHLLPRRRHGGDGDQPRAVRHLRLRPGLE